MIVSPKEIVDYWRLEIVNVTLGDLGELGELPHWRLANVTPRCFVAGAQ